MRIQHRTYNKKLKSPGNQAGVAAVEFAIVIILLLMIVSAIIEFGRVFWYYDALTKATRDGARLMSLADKATINSVSVPAAEDLVKSAANNARISPALANANVEVECLNASYGVVNCVDDVAPENVRVTIVGFTVTLGEWIPIFRHTGVTSFETTSFGIVSLSPDTTMRYMR